MASVEVGVCLDTGHANLTGDMHTVFQKLSGRTPHDPSAKGE
jgi:sugar phosphate isomerase/epimerase